MTKRSLKTALYAAGAVTLSLSVTSASFAQFQQNRSRQYQQSDNPLDALIGMIGRVSAKSKAKKKWAQVGPDIQQCVNTYLESRKITVQQMIAEGLSPDHEKVTPIVTMCQTVMATQLKANFPCNVANAKGQQVPTTCVQSYAKAVNGKWVPVSRDDFLRAGSNNEQVTIADFETQAAQNTRLAEERRIVQEAAAKAEEERLRFAASPAGKIQAELLSPNANWIALRGGGPPQYYDASSVNSGPAWTNYRRVVVHRQSEDVNGQKIMSDFRISDTAVECSEVQDRYVLWIKTYHFEGKFDPKNLKATASGARMIAQEAKPEAFSNASWQDEINTMCRSKPAQTGFALDQELKKAVARGRALHGPRLAKEREEARRRPRGYEIVCNGSVKSYYNLYVVNCQNKQSVNMAYRWAYNILSVQTNERGGVHAKGCLDQSYRYNKIYDDYMKAGLGLSEDFVQNLFLSCNVGLWWAHGPSAEQAARRKR